MSRVNSIAIFFDFGTITVSAVIFLRDGVGAVVFQIFNGDLVSRIRHIIRTDFAVNPALDGEGVFPGAAGHRCPRAGHIAGAGVGVHIGFAVRGRTGPFGDIRNRILVFILKLNSVLEQFIFKVRIVLVIGGHIVSNHHIPKDIPFIGNIQDGRIISGKRSVNFRLRSSSQRIIQLRLSSFCGCCIDFCRGRLEGALTDGIRAKRRPCRIGRRGSIPDQLDLIVVAAKGRG